MFNQPPRRKVFVSFCQGDRAEVDRFVHRWATREQVFIPRALGVSSNDDFIDSMNTDYVMGRIRQTYLGDSTITIVLIGTCTHSRRYVDWELKASLRRGELYIPNGLLGILLPSAQQGAHLPERFAANWEGDETNCYALYRHYPQSASDLSAWIEEAYVSRRSHADFIKNSAGMMRYNGKCAVCGVTH